MGARRRGGNVSIGLMDLSDLAYVDDVLPLLLVPDVDIALEAAKMWGHIVSKGGFKAN